MERAWESEPMIKAVKEKYSWAKITEAAARTL
jgi:hypothetical protein